MEFVSIKLNVSKQNVKTDNREDLSGLPVVRNYPDIPVIWHNLFPAFYFKILRISFSFCSLSKSIKAQIYVNFRFTLDLILIVLVKIIPYYYFFSMLNFLLIYKFSGIVTFYKYFLIIEKKNYADFFQLQVIAL